MLGSQLCSYLWSLLLLYALSIISASGAPHPGPKIQTYEVLREFPHDHHAFTQGLEYDRLCDDSAQECKDIFWESTGMYGRSSVRQVAVANGSVLRQAMMEAKYFGEGLTRMGKTLYQIVWQSGKGFTYDTNDLSQSGSFHSGLEDGWGLTNDGTHLIVTDSSETLYWIDPITFKKVKSLTIKDGDHALPWFNELEYINGELWANVWQTECIARVNLTTGHVSHWILMHGLRDSLLRRPGTQRGLLDVLNGIAWDDMGKRLFVTGKQWPAVFEITLKDFLPGQIPSLQHVRERCWPHSSGR